MGLVVVLKPLKLASQNSAKKRGHDDDDITYEERSVVKLGCNKCQDVFYSEGGYNAHLFKKIESKNVFRHPPTMINKLWSRIPERPPLQEGQRECDICRARFLDPNNFIRH